MVKREGTEHRVCVREATEAERQSWDELIGRFPNSRVFHSRAWLDSLVPVAGSAPVHLVAEQDGEIVGCCPGFVTRLGPLTMFASPREGWQTQSMGPVFDPLRVDQTQLVAALIGCLERRYRVAWIEMVSSQLDARVMSSFGFHGLPLLTYRARLGSDEREAFQAFDRKTRNQVRKASHLGLIVRTRADSWLAGEFYAQASEVFRRQGLSVPFGIGRVRSFCEHLERSGYLLPVTVHTPDAGDCIATGLFAIFRGELVLWGWTHKRAYGSLCPTELLTWTAVQRGLAARCTAFEMTGDGPAKRKFGAERDWSNVRWMRTRIPGLIQARRLLKSLYRCQQHIRGRLAGLSQYVSVK